MRNNRTIVGSLAGLRSSAATIGFVAALAMCIGLSPQAHALTANDCAQLINVLVPNTTIRSATLIAEGGGLPEYCQVTGFVDTEIDFELHLPTQWNGKFVFQGLGGLDGIVPGPGAALQRGFAEVGTNTG